MDMQHVPPDDEIVNNNPSVPKNDRQCVSLPVLCDKNESIHFNPGHGMECMQLNTPIGAYHYHVADQTKSLQELQNEVGALLEFRDLVIETFPDLKSKMASLSSSNAILSSSSPLNSRRDWESGTRIRRKMIHQPETSDVHTLSRSRSNSNSGKKEPKSGEANNGSAIQDSGFSTETNSSKDTHSATSTNGTTTNATVGASGGSSGFQRTSSHEVEDDLWNLLDVIHRKSTRLRDEMEHIRLLGRKSNSNIRDFTQNDHHHGVDVDKCSARVGDLFQLELNRINNEDMHILRKERDCLLDKLAEMEAQTVAGQIRTNRMQSELNALHLVKNNLEDQLRAVISQKFDLNTKSHGRDQNDIPIISLDSARSRQRSTMVERKLSSPDTYMYQSNVTGNNLSPNNANFNKSEHSETTIKPSTRPIYMVNDDVLKDNFNLGRLDGLVSSPNRCNKVRMTDSRKIAAILLETNSVELQRHLLTITIQNQTLTQKLEQATKSKIYLIKKLDKAKERIDDLKFQLEERNIELEGTKAQLRVLSSKSNKAIGSEIFASSTASNQISTPSMKAMIPLALDEINSSTDSTDDQIERDEMNNRSTISKSRPSKIPLAGTKVNFSPKPPTGRNSSRSSSGPPSNKSLSKSSTSLASNRYEMTSSTPKSSSSNSTAYPRSDSVLSVRNNTSSIPVSTQKSPTTSYANKQSPVPKIKRESFSARVRNMDSLSRLHTHTSSTQSSISVSTTMSTTTNTTATSTLTSTSTQSSSVNSSPTHIPNDRNTSPYKIRDKKQINTQNPTASPARRMTHTSFGSKGIDLSTEPVEKVQTNLRKIWNMLKI